MLIGIALYFVLAVGLATLLFVPSARRAVAHRFSRAMRTSQSFGRQGQAGAELAGHGVRGAASATGYWLRSRGPWILGGLILLTLMPMMALWLRDRSPADTYDHRVVRPRDDRIAGLLQGEQLVPPPPVAPELFMQQEVQLARPMVQTASREWALLDPEFRQRLLVVFQLLRERHGYEAVLLEGYRSPERQAKLSAMGPTVTQAGAFESYHQYGLAADVAFMRNGRIVISERDPWAMNGYELYGELAREVGLTWGGSWRTLKDYGHVELRRSGVLRRAADNAHAGPDH